MEVTSVILAISTMGIIIVFGALIALKISITAEMKNILMMIILNLAVPFIILNGVFNTKITDVIFQQVFLVFGISIVFNAGGIILTLVLGRLLHLNQPKQLALLAALGNTGFIGIPLSATLFGPLGGLLAAVFDAGLDVVLFSLGIYLLQSNQKFQFKQLKALLNIPLLAISLGLLYVISGLEAPIIFKQLASMLSNLAARLSASNFLSSWTTVLLSRFMVSFINEIVDITTFRHHLFTFYVNTNRFNFLISYFNKYAYLHAGFSIIFPLHTRRKRSHYGNGI
ncbi:hypothetical protein MKX67_05905 [Cytobacillus sp. FSL W7-1323]|uniref:AEC family transporter n=1 Tax=Cytobacillus sp. FSL W7-1323 TaxID=2921700 RepID=UPI003158F2EE